jgi:hypothetical protein
MWKCCSEFTVRRIASGFLISYDISGSWDVHRPRNGPEINDVALEARLLRQSLQRQSLQNRRIEEAEEGIRLNCLEAEKILSASSTPSDELRAMPNIFVVEVDEFLTCTYERP